MSRITLIDPQMAGISGDMLLAAMIDAGADVKKIQSVFDVIPLHYQKCKTILLHVNEVKKHGFRASAVDLKITEDRGEAGAQDLLSSAEKIARASKMSEKASRLATKSIEELVNVESKLHKASPEMTQLHEAGSADTLADTLGVAAACESLGIFDGEVYSTPVAVGGGLLTFSHGTVVAPPPAVLEIAKQRGIPIQGGPENVELATPTGIAILANLAGKFVNNYPSMVPEVVGYGAGRTELTGTPNLLRVVMGHPTGSAPGRDLVTILETNLDDVSGEVLAHALQQVLDSGAKDVWITPAQFKKNRPGQVLHAICDPSAAENVAEVIMDETGTLGVRFQQSNRFTLQREIRTIRVDIDGRTFDVRVKVTTKSGRAVNIKPEFDDIQTIAKTLSMPARKVSETVIRQVAEGTEQ